jgi:hypothetical protein
VVYGDEYRDPSGLEILRPAGVKARKFPLDDNI